jgi:hypothetical protein
MGRKNTVSLRVGGEAGAADAGADVVVEAVATAAPARAAGACSPMGFLAHPFTFFLLKT